MASSLDCRGLMGHRLVEVVSYFVYLIGHRRAGRSFSSRVEVCPSADIRKHWNVIGGLLSTWPDMIGRTKREPAFLYGTVCCIHSKQGAWRGYIKLCTVAVRSQMKAHLMRLTSLLHEISLTITRLFSRRTKTKYMHAGILAVQGVSRPTQGVPKPSLEVFENLLP